MAVEKISNNNTWFHGYYRLSLEEEKQAVEDIQQGRKYLPVDDENLSKKQRERKQIAQDGVYRLVKGYSGFIEMIAKEQAKNNGRHATDLEDYLAEAYLVAVRSARTFNPEKAGTSIRFSSYVSRTLVSSLRRLTARSKTTVSATAKDVMDSETWSRIYFESKDINAGLTDDNVSQISGVNMGHRKALQVLALNENHPLDEQVAEKSGVTFIPEVSGEDFNEKFIQALRNVLGDQLAEEMSGVLSLSGGGEVSAGIALLSHNLDVDTDTAKEILSQVRGIFNHPSVRVQLEKELGF